MANTSVDFWPTDFGTIDLVPPVTILREQATILGHKTKNILEGYVLTSTTNNIAFSTGGKIRGTDGFTHEFRLKAKALNDYTYSLFTAMHSITLYPVIVRTDTFYECGNQAEFEEALRHVFASDETKRVIQALLALSTAQEPEHS